MLSRKISDSTVKERLAKIQKRTTNTHMPHLGDAFRTKEQLVDGLGSDIMDKVYFSKYPNAERDGAAAISAILLNGENVEELRKSGGLGAVLEMLRRLDLKKMTNSEHLSNLIHSLHTLVLGSKSVQLKSLSNPFTVDTLLSICGHCSGLIQSKTFEIIDCLSKCENGLQMINSKGALNTLMAPELLTRKSSSLEIKHAVANLIHRCATVSPQDFPLRKYESIAFRKDGVTSAFDCYMEMQMLQAVRCHLNYNNEHGIVLKEEFGMLKYYLNCVVMEQFESIDHLQSILKVIIASLKDVRQMDFMMENGLDIVLQYLVRTDFELYRKKNAKSSFGKKAEKDMAVNSDGTICHTSNKKKSERTPGTLMALDLIRKPLKAASRSEDINLTIAKIALSIYEGIMEHKVTVIGEIVSSGLIPALLHRVGKGVHVDKHFCKLLTRFLSRLLRSAVTANAKALQEDIEDESTMREVMDEVPTAPTGQSIGPQDDDVSVLSNMDSVDTMRTTDVCDQQSANSMSSSQTKKTIQSYVLETSNAVRGHNSVDAAPSVSMNVAKFRMKVSGTEIRTISHTLHAQGCTEMFSNSIINSEDNEVVLDSMQSLGMLTYEAIHASIESNLVLIGRICLLTNNRLDCFLPGISLISEVSTAICISLNIYVF